VAPEPIEDDLLRALPGAKQVVLVGNGRSYIAALITGAVSPHEAEAAIAAVNQRLPHYKRVHAFHLCAEPFTVDNGLLTANGKLKRGAIEARHMEEIEAMYRKRESGVSSQKSEPRPLGSAG
jgi:long-chain acyl-CoA synthetase